MNKFGISIKLIVIILLSCSAPNDKTSEGSDSTSAPEVTAKPNDSLSYIGFVEPFETTQELYTDLYFAESFNYDNYDRVVKLGDSVLFRGDEETGTRIPFDKAASYFNLTGLAQIDIYDSKNLKIGTGTLARIEYIENLIEGRFVAVFTPSVRKLTDAAYCIGNAGYELQELRFADLANTTLDTLLTNQLNIDKERLWSIKHFRPDKSDEIYSTISADTTAFIICTVGNESKVLYRSMTSEGIRDLLITSIVVNKKPVLLATCYLPESDMSWNSVLVFDGKAYQPDRDHRIKF